MFAFRPTQSGLGHTSSDGDEGFVPDYRMLRVLFCRSGSLCCGSILVVADKDDRVFVFYRLKVGSGVKGPSFSAGHWEL